MWSELEHYDFASLEKCEGDSDRFGLLYWSEHKKIFLNVKKSKEDVRDGSLLFLA